MPGDRGVWRAEADGIVAAEVRGYRLVVRLPEQAGGPIRFLVLRRMGGDGPHALVGSGTEPDVRTAMAEAVRMADRLVEPPGEMRRIA
jgi:hypothetical protein